MIRVVVTGSECTGKTTLAADLAAHYGTVWVPEYARRFVQQKVAPPTSGDVAAIARGQIEEEDRVAAGADALLVQDTDLLSTVVYAHHYYGACPGWIETALRTRTGNLYLLAGVDVPWVADGALRDRGDRREELHGLFRNALLDRGLRFVELAGPPPERLRQAVAAVDVLLATGPPPRAGR